MAIGQWAPTATALLVIASVGIVADENEMSSRLRPLPAWSVDLDNRPPWRILGRATW